MKTAVGAFLCTILISLLIIVMTWLSTYGFNYYTELPPGYHFAVDKECYTWVDNDGHIATISEKCYGTDNFKKALAIQSAWSFKKYLGNKHTEWKVLK